MAFIVCLFLLCFVLGMVAVASNPSPYHAAFGLVIVAGMGCGVLLSYGGAFLSLILFLIYLGGMLVVFAYSAALAAEPHPEAWGSRSVLAHVLVYVGGVLLVSGCFMGEWYEDSFMIEDEVMGFTLLQGDVGGVSLMYYLGGWMLVASAWVLLLALFVVLELIRGLSRGAVRAV
uniref:NADH-ubiquinone oxidoreductase chain 6 n=1 Tax=Citharoides macrolepis TaxID=195602 RepID=A0A1N7T5N0_9PLEU|nr:NADH dehydrogenase subunit 6 [Citharoides macrolepis]